MTNRRLLALAFTMSVAVVACGGGDGDTEAASSNASSDASSDASVATTANPSLAGIKAGGGTSDNGDDDRTTTTSRRETTSTSDQSAGGDDQLAAMRSQLLAFNEEDNDGELTDAEAVCLTDGMIDAIGTSRMLALWAEQNDFDEVIFTQEEAEKLAPIMRECVDFGALITDEIAADGISEASAQCFADEVFTDDVVDQILVGTFTGADEDALMDEILDESIILTAFTDCLTPEELDALLG